VREALLHLLQRTGELLRERGIEVPTRPTLLGSAPPDHQVADVFDLEPQGLELVAVGVLGDDHADGVGCVAVLSAVEDRQRRVAERDRLAVGLFAVGQMREDAVDGGDRLVVVHCRQSAVQLVADPRARDLEDRGRVRGLR
jgi:hypothetical protein